MPKRSCWRFSKCQVCLYLSQVWNKGFCPVTLEVAGSSPVGSAINFFIISSLKATIRVVFVGWGRRIQKGFAEFYCGAASSSQMSDLVDKAE